MFEYIDLLWFSNIVCSYNSCLKFSCQQKKKKKSNTVSIEKHLYIFCVRKKRCILMLIFEFTDAQFSMKFVTYWKISEKKIPGITCMRICENKCQCEMWIQNRFGPNVFVCAKKKKKTCSAQKTTWNQFILS